jgi:hypothetical protein
VYEANEIEKIIKTKSRNRKIIAGIVLCITLVVFAFTVFVFPRLVSEQIEEVVGVKKSLDAQPNIPAKAESYVSAAGQTGKSVTFSGTGIQTARPFTVSGPWEAKWSTTDKNISFYLYDQAGDIVGVFGLATSGTHYSAKGGTYYFMANSPASWEIKIVPIS